MEEDGSSGSKKRERGPCAPLDSFLSGWCGGFLSALPLSAFFPHLPDTNHKKRKTEERKWDIVGAIVIWLPALMGFGDFMGMLYYFYLRRTKNGARNWYVCVRREQQL